jgi:hypothetical protein
MSIKQDQYTLIDDTGREAACYVSMARSARRERGPVGG